MPTAVHDDPAAFAALALRWRTLLDRDPAASVFHTPQYLATWWSEFGAGAKARIVEIGDDDAMRGVAALTLWPDRRMTFAGDHDTTDYRGPVCAPEDREEMASAVLAAVAEDDWTSFEMDGLSADSGWVGALTAAAKDAGYSVSETANEPCPRVTIPSASFDEYLASISGKLRHEILRKARRLERDGGPFRVRLATEATLDDDLEKFFSMHRSSDGPKGRFMHEGMASFFGSFAWMLFSQRWLRLALLEIGDEPWAGVYAFRYGDSWDVWNSAFDHAKRELAPGMVLMSECIRLAAEEGCTVFDFLRGPEPYKYRFGAVDVQLFRLLVERG
jgi:CelD/BcsL family acetyltransferase involved in cellulose biosynthesis